MRFGYHVRMSGRPAGAVAEGVAAGCETIQVFPGPPQQWGTRATTEEEGLEFRRAAREAGIQPVTVHSIYLVNMASPDRSIHGRSVSSLAAAMDKAHRLGAAYVVTHIGNHRGEGEEHGILRIQEALEAVLPGAPGEVELLLETTAGAGTSIGHTFEQFGRVFDAAGRPERLGFCLDTCHVFAAGYDISTAGGLAGSLEELDRHIGLGLLKLLHLNDSRGDCGSRLDRHADIGMGRIGLEAFRRIVNHPSLRGLPAIVELPPGGQDSRDNIGLLRSLVE